MKDRKEWDPMDPYAFDQSIVSLCVCACVLFANKLLKRTEKDLAVTCMWKKSCPSKSRAL